ncbi:leucine-rich repeat-containing protein 51-like [Anabrus simplex]|uniref:leucine-rich repeat-containing protein 51-like n=1 Tax=Anabrus simplex TaxID=316456 RepID=UPI0035A3A2EA
MRQRSVQEEICFGSPIDYSFKKITSLEQLTNERPRALRVGRTPVRGPSNRFLTRSVWLNHNNLRNMVYLKELLNGLLEQPSALGWIDFSFNMLTEVDKDLLLYPNLKIVYLHGNLIRTLDSIALLKELKKLKTLTLQGNPVDAIHLYRAHVINLLPQIANLDFAPVLPRERCLAVPPGTANRYYPVNDPRTAPEKR